jgi:hypothetical protein
VHAYHRNQFLFEQHTTTSEIYINSETRIQLETIENAQCLCVLVEFLWQTNISESSNVKNKTLSGYFEYVSIPKNMLMNAKFYKLFRKKKPKK